MPRARGDERLEKEDVKMEPSIWGRLPDELLERILSLLPLRTIIALRPTCKHFQSLLTTPSFLALIQGHCNHAPPSNFLLLSHPQFARRFLPLYDASVDAWRSARIPSSTNSSSAPLLSASSGLLCFCLYSSRHPPSLLVSNLLTNTSKILPLPINSSPPTSATIISLPSASPHGYKIFLPSPSFPDSVFVYDSASLTWTRYLGLESLLGRGSSHQDGAFFNGSLYFATHEPFSVVSFNIRSGGWDIAGASAAALPAELAFARLVSSPGGDRLYLVGGVGRNGISRCLKVWELIVSESSGGGGGGRGQGQSRAWVELGQLPEMMCRKFVSVCYHNYSHVYCLWHDGLVCICCTTWPEVLFFKVTRGTWHWLPKCPMLPEKWSCGFRWFSFVPDLYALV